MYIIRGKKKMEKRSNVQAIIIIILVVILIGATVYLGITHFTKQNNQLKPNQQLTDNKQQENEKTFEKQFVNYLAEVVIQGAKNESLLKDTEGNATADKLTEREAINNKGQYIKILEKNMNNREIFSAQFIKDEKQCIVFNMEKMLNLLGVGTHMGTGMGVSDDNGMQLYMVGDKATVNSNNVFEEFYMHPSEAMVYHNIHRGKGRMLPVFDGDQPVTHQKVFVAFFLNIARAHTFEY